MLRAALAVGSLCLAMATQNPARGVVVDESGRPLIGAVVWSWWASEQPVTSFDGTFIAEMGRYRVLADGYAPRILSSAAFAEPIVMRPASTPRRDLPRCAAGEGGLGELYIATPAGVQVAHAGHEDYVSETWSRQGSELRHAHGPTWTEGLPPDVLLSQLTHVDDRDVRLVDADNQDGLPISDVRGRFADGRRYRYVGIFGESFEYSGLTAADAAFFDRMLDAMCYVVREPATVDARRRGAPGTSSAASSR